MYRPFENIYIDLSTFTADLKKINKIVKKQMLKGK